MGWVLPLLFSIVGIIVTILVVIIVVKTTEKTKKIDVHENAVYILVGNRRKYTTGNYALGLIKKEKLCKNGCTRFEYYPCDKLQGEDIKNPPLQRVICKNEFVRRFAPGEYFNERAVVVLLDRFKSDLPRKMRETKEGEDMSKAGQKAFLESAIGSYVTAGDEALHEMISGISRVGMTKLTLAQIKEANEAMRAGRIPSEGEGKKD